MRIREFLLSVVIGLGVACSSSAGQQPPPPPPPPPPPFRLEITGNNIYFAGEKATVVSAIRAIESPEPIYWTVEGPGYLAKDQLGLEPTTQWGSPYYIPPASVPGGGDTTAKVYFTTKDLYYGGMAKSPELIMQIRTLKEPMKFEGNNALELVVGPGGKIDLGARVLPPPFLFNSRTSIVWNIASTAPAVADPGQVALDPIQNDYRGCLAVYTAPGVVSEDLIVTITAITHDPWFNLDPVLTWKVRVKKP